MRKRKQLFVPAPHGNAETHRRIMERSADQVADSAVKAGIYTGTGEFTAEYKPDDVLRWYKGPCTRKRVAELRQKLAVARGMLIEVVDAVGSDVAVDVKDAIDKTAD
jgi:hypothetical protein